MGELYKLTFPNGKCYIGITTVGAARRYAGHARGAAAGSKTKLYNAWRKHGAPALTTLAILEDGELAAAEARAVAAYETYGPRGYNSTPGGDVSPMTLPEIAAKAKGKTRSPETRAKMSVSMKGNANTLGHKRTKEQRAAISARMKGNSRSLGCKRSQETRAKMSAAQLRRQETKRQHNKELAA